MQRTVGIIGGGQLARMLALAGYPLGLKFLVLDPSPDACAGQLAQQLVADYDDANALAELAERCEVVTFDFENVPVAALERIQGLVKVLPGPKALAVSQDRLVEKRHFRSLGIGTAPFAKADSLNSLQAALAQVGTPALVKTRRFGYDGKGQVRVNSTEQAQQAWKQLAGHELIVEGMVKFERELSVVGARGRDGEVRFYPLTQNHHRDGILASSFAPAPVKDTGMVAEAQMMWRSLAESLDYVGVMALELFDADGSFLANEMAPRVHNSGHWTMDGADTGQFENHLRAILGMPLGATRALGYCAMINWIGQLPDPEAALRCEGTHWHDYGKHARAGRKVGHLNIRADDLQNLQKLMALFAAGLADGFESN
jgi:5-(carboxyamino)imidazole ribonucleotide synthase